MDTIGKRLKEIRSYKGFGTHNELANFLDVSTSGIATLERDESQPSFKMITAIRTKMPEINIMWLLYREGDMVGNQINSLQSEKFEKDISEKEYFNFLKDEIKFLRNLVMNNQQNPTSQLTAR